MVYMAKNTGVITNDCAMAGIKPAMLELPYPLIQVRCRNRDYAELLKVDYCGAVSELSAITQYINNQNRMACEKCSFAKMILAIAMAEMMHLQKLGELIDLLGGEVDYSAMQPSGKQKLWTPAFLTLSGNIRKMLCAGIESEKGAIMQYRNHISMIKDDCVNAVLLRIIKDEEYHILLLQALMEEL